MEVVDLLEYFIALFWTTNLHMSLGSGRVSKFIFVANQIYERIFVLKIWKKSDFFPQNLSLIQHINISLQQTISLSFIQESTLVVPSTCLIIIIKNIQHYCSLKQKYKHTFISDLIFILTLLPSHNHRGRDLDQQHEFQHESSLK